MFIRMKWRLSRVCCFGENADANLARCRCRDATDVWKSTSSTESESEDDLGSQIKILQKCYDAIGACQREKGGVH